MNVKDMIAALQQLDPNAPAGDAVKAIRQQARQEHFRSLTTKEGILAFFPALLARVSAAKDSKGNSNENPRREAFNALRSEVHEAFLFLNPTPPAADLEKNFTSLGEKAKSAAIHEIQKAHNIGLWEQTDALIASTGISAEGGV